VGTLLTRGYVSTNRLRTLIYEGDDFVSTFVNRSNFWKDYNLKFKKDEKTDFGSFLFCDLISNLQEPAKDTLGCNEFYPVSTGYGPCYSYNSLASKQLYRESLTLEQWVNFFQLPESINLTYPSLYGPAQSFYFVLQSFEQNAIRLG
jgi:hypothetical protein